MVRGAWQSDSAKSCAEKCALVPAERSALCDAMRPAGILVACLFYPHFSPCEHAGVERPMPYDTPLAQRAHRAQMLV